MTDSKSFDILTIGNAIVDVLVKTDDKFLAGLGLKKGTMSLIDKEKAAKLFAIFKNPEAVKISPSQINEMSGGCAANVAAGISSFGGKAAFIGKVSDDEAGKRFTEKLHGRGIEFSTPASGDGTGKSLIIVTEDGSRTMCTYLGSTGEISKDDIKEDIVAKSKIIFLSAFSWDSKNGKDAAMTSIELAKKNGCKVAFTLADPVCVERHKKEIVDVVDKNVDIVFANEMEINALLGTKSCDEAAEKLKEKFAGTEKIAALTCGSKGALIITKDGITKAEAEKVKSMVDKTGAGSLFVSGFLYAHTHGFDIEKSARLANMAAAECLSHLGARPQIKLKDLIVKL